MTHNELVIHTHKVAQAVGARRCFCEKYKVQSLPLCRRCFNLLPAEMQNAIVAALYGESVATEPLISATFEARMEKKRNSRNERHPRGVVSESLLAGGTPNSPRQILCRFFCYYASVTWGNLCFRFHWNRRLWWYRIVRGWSHKRVLAFFEEEVAEGDEELLKVIRQQYQGDDHER